MLELYKFTPKLYLNEYFEDFSQFKLFYLHQEDLILQEKWLFYQIYRGFQIK